MMTVFRPNAMYGTGNAMKNVRSDAKANFGSDVINNARGDAMINVRCDAKANVGSSRSQEKIPLQDFLQRRPAQAAPLILDCSKL